MVKHKPYPKYKPSGIDWIGDIPQGWEVRRLRFCLKEPLKYGANEIAIEDDKNLPRYIRITDFDENGLLREDTFRSLPFEKAKDYILEDGDILFARSGATVGKTFQFKNYDGQACFAGYLIKASPDEKVIKSDYVYYFTKSIAYENWKNSIFSQATIQNIGADKYQELVISFPENEHAQIEIINHIEKKTAQIDDLIQKKEEMIKLLKEKRAAIINQAVTKGLDPNAKMKSSGIDWIGDIPEGWDVLRLKYKILLDPSKNEVLKIISLDDDVTFLPMAYVTEGGDINDENEKKLEDVFSGYTYFRDNDVVVAKITPCFENGKGALIEGMKNCIGFGTTEFFVLRSKSLDEKYLFYLTKSDYFRKIGEASMKGAAGQKRIPDSFIKDFKIGFPEQTEQKRIASYLDKKTTEIDGLIQKIESAIVKLREYRSSLITAAVTGKIDVRGK